MGISREDINSKTIHEHNYRVCSRHFVTGKPAMLYETNSPNWLSTLNLGHKKHRYCTRTPVNMERYKRVPVGVRRRNAIEELMKELPVVVPQLVEKVITEEVKVTATKELAGNILKSLLEIVA